MPDSAVSFQSTFWFLPRAPNTVTTKLHPLELPAASLAVQTTTMLPTGNMLPEDTEVTVFGWEQVSLAAIWKNTEAPSSFANSTVIFEGHVVDGGVVSRTVTLDEHVEDRPRLFITV
jgi:hypothetical protein